MWGSLESAERDVEAAGKRIQDEGLPRELAPFTFVFTEEGMCCEGLERLSDGCLMYCSIAECIARSTDLQGTIATSETCESRESEACGAHSKRGYYAHPDRYEGVFQDHITP